MTLCRVLGGSSRGSARTWELVLRDAERLHYQPDPHLMRLKRLMQVVRGRKEQRVASIRVQVSADDGKTQVVLPVPDGARVSAVVIGGKDGDILLAFCMDKI